MRSDSFYSKEKLIILFQSIEAIYGKKLYFAFKALSEGSPYLSEDPSFEISEEENYS